MYIKEGPLNNQSAGTPRDKWLARQPKLLDDFLIMGISLNDLLGIYPGIYWDLTIGIGDILWYSIILIGDIWRYCDMCDFLLDISSMVNCEILDIWCFFCGIHCLCIIPAMGCHSSHWSRGSASPRASWRNSEGDGWIWSSPFPGPKSLVPWKMAHRNRWFTY